MTVKELIERLQKVDQDAIVIISADSEGNYYNELDDFWDENVVFWEDAPYLEKLTEGDIKEGYGEEDCRSVDEDGAVKCVVLYP